MFDTLLADVAARFGLPLDTARRLLAQLIALIFNEKSGGAAGFADLLRSRGLGPMVDSWIGQGPNQPITSAQLEQALGADEIDVLASQTGLERSLVGSALAALLPDTFNSLSEDGRLPATLPDRIRGFLAGLGGAPGTVGLGTAAAVGVARAADRTGSAVHEAARDIGVVDRHAVRETSSGIGRLLPWLLLGGLLVAALLWSRGCRRDEAVVPPPADATPAARADAATTAGAPRVGFANRDGQVTIDGRLASEAEKRRLIDALKAAFGADNIRDDISIDTTLAPAGWLDRLIALIPDLKANGLKFQFDGDRLKLDSSGLSEAERFALTEKFRIAFRDGPYEITGLWDRAMAALAGLKDGFSGGDLVKALNLMNVYFATGSATITGDSMETLRAAADAIKRAPARTRIEAGGHTDNTGDAAANMTLSQQRAEAVVGKLRELGVADGMLSAKGYGQDKPVASNATEEGKAKNRRMEFTVLE